GMALAPAFGFVLLGGSLWVTDRRLLGRYLVAPWIALLAAGFPHFALIAHGYGVSSAGPLARGGMPVHSAAGQLLVGLGILAARSRSSFVALMLSRGPGGRLARVFLPILVLAPPLLGWLALAGDRIGYYGSEMVVPLLVAL